MLDEQAQAAREAIAHVMLARNDLYRGLGIGDEEPGYYARILAEAAQSLLEKHSSIDYAHEPVSYRYELINIAAIALFMAEATATGNWSP